MVKKTKTEITIETHRKLIIRARKSYVLVWCAMCRETRRMVSPEEALAPTGLSLRTIYRAIEAGEVHFLETFEGALLVCLKSLGVAHNNDSPAVEPLLQLIGQTGEEQTYESFAYPDQPPVAVAAVSPSEKTQRLAARKKDWVLTAAALDGLLDCLDPDRESAGMKYESIRRKLMKYFECRGCAAAEELADETINRVARRVSEGKEIWTTDPASYFYGVARNVLREYWGAPDRELTPVGLLPPPAHPYQDTLKLKEMEDEKLIEEQLLEALDRGMRKLPAESRELIIKYYQGEKGDKIKNRKDMAERLGIPANALRIRVHRIREKLEKQVADCLNRHAK